MGRVPDRAPARSDRLVRCPAPHRRAGLGSVYPGSKGQPEWEWRHYDLINAQARRSVDTDPTLPDIARSVLLGTDETPRLLEEKGVVAGVLPAYALTAAKVVDAGFTVIFSVPA